MWTALAFRLDAMYLYQEFPTWFSLVLRSRAEKHSRYIGENDNNLCILFDIQGLDDSLIYSVWWYHLFII